MRPVVGAAHDAEETARERARLRVVLLTIANAVGGVIVFSILPGSDGRTAAAIGLLNNAVLIAFALRRRDAVVGRLLLFGIVVGVVELAADAWLVDHTRTLDYAPSGSLMVWRSPWWMILAWEIVALQLGYVGLRLRERLGARGVVLAGVLGAINIPFYEEMALRLSWWRYRGCPMLSNTPVYIIVGELLIVMGFALAAGAVRRPGLARVAGAGAAAGAGIFASYALAWSLVEALR
jgi:hypothetical protein